MRFVSALSTSEDPALCLRELEQQLARQEGSWDLLLLFVAGKAPPEMELLAEGMHSAWPEARLVGCGASGTIGGGQENYQGCSATVLAGELPGVAVESFRIRPDDLDEDPLSFLGSLIPVSDVPPSFVVFADPFTFPVEPFLSGMNTTFPGCPVLGGMASAGGRRGQNRLFLNGRSSSRGLVGCSLAGALQVSTVLSQGCRPLGKHYLVTGGEGNLIHQLGGRPTLSVLQDLVEGLEPRDVALIRRGGLFLGRAINEYQSHFGRGDFLIQNVLGSDPERGSLAVAGPVRRGTTVQFHVRDARSADEDLRAMLAAQVPQNGRPGPKGALLFSCTGRGEAMWPGESHDITVLQELLGPLPVGGFFCAGELGPVAGTNFIHGFTASIGLFSEKPV